MFKTKSLHSNITLLRSRDIIGILEFGSNTTTTVTTTFPWHVFSTIGLRVQQYIFCCNSTYFGYHTYIWQRKANEKPRTLRFDTRVRIDILPSLVLCCTTLLPEKAKTKISFGFSFSLAIVCCQGLPTLHTQQSGRTKDQSIDRSINHDEPRKVFQGSRHVSSRARRQLDVHCGKRWLGVGPKRIARRGPTFARHARGHSCCRQ